MSHCPVCGSDFPLEDLLRRFARRLGVEAGAVGRLDVLTASFAGGSSQEAAKVVLAEGLEFDRDRLTLWVSGEPHYLTVKDSRLLNHFLRNAGKLLRREHILAAVWDAGTQVTDHALDCYVSRLRGYLSAHPTGRSAIVTVKRIGYRFEFPHEPNI